MKKFILEFKNNGGYWESEPGIIDSNLESEPIFNCFDSLEEANDNIPESQVDIFRAVETDRPYTLEEFEAFVEEIS